MYYLGMSFSDQAEAPLPELEWIYGWLVTKKKEEAEESKK
jgi:hypothetical protein